MLSLAACSSGSASGPPSDDPSASGSPAAVVATIYGQGEPPNAPGQVLTQYHVTVPPGAAIAPHQHPGMQIGRVTSGELTYTVDKGAVTVFDGTASPGGTVASKQVAAPATITLTPGTTISEREGMVHQAKNNGSQPVELDLSIITPKGEPLSIPEKP